MNKRLEELDVLRVIGCIAVIIIHVSAGSLVRFLPNSPHLKLAYIVNTYTKFAVPLFIFLSGVVLIYVYNNKPLNFVMFMNSRLLSIGVPYVIWNLIYYIVFVLRGIYPVDALFFIKQLLLGTLVYHFYFVVIIFQFYLLSNLWLYIFKHWNASLILMVSAVINYISMKYFYFPYADRLFINYLFFFILGCYLMTLKDKAIVLLYKTRTLLCLLTLTIGGIYTYLLYQARVNGVGDLLVTDFLWYLYSSVAILSMYFISKTLATRYPKLVAVLKPIGDASFYIYLSHPLFLMISNNIVSVMGINSVTFITLFNMIFVTIFSSTISIIYLKRSVIYKNIEKAFK